MIPLVQACFFIALLVHLDEGKCKFELKFKASLHSNCNNPISSIRSMIIVKHSINGHIISIFKEILNENVNIIELHFVYDESCLPERVTSFNAEELLIV